MLALVTIFLATLLTAVTTIWLYRSLAGLKLGAQQEFISLFASSKKTVRKKRLRSPKDGIKSAWGW